MDFAFATDVVSGREKNGAETENKLAEETRLKYFTSYVFSIIWNKFLFYFYLFEIYISFYFYSFEINQGSTCSSGENL